LTGAPDRGDIVWLDFTPKAGRETAERRPALVLSPQKFNIATGLALVCPITNQVKGSPFEIPLPSGAGATGAVLASEVRSLDYMERRATRKGRAPADVVDAVVDIVRAIVEGR